MAYNHYLNDHKNIIFFNKIKKKSLYITNTATFVINCWFFLLLNFKILIIIYIFKSFYSCKFSSFFDCINIFKSFLRFNVLLQPYWFNFKFRYNMLLRKYHTPLLINYVYFIATTLLRFHIGILFLHMKHMSFLWSFILFYNRICFSKCIFFWTIICFDIYSNWWPRKKKKFKLN